MSSFDECPRCGRAKLEESVYCDACLEELEECGAGLND